MILPIILSGGSGTRLWPLSTTELPKQLLPLLSTRSLLQETVLRLDELGPDCAPPLIICNETHSAVIARQLTEIGRPQAFRLHEPEGRNTAPAIAVAAMLCEELSNESDPTLLVLPADHAIGDAIALAKTVERARAAADEGLLVTFGVLPDRPETGYGYIKRGARDGNHYIVERFVEKPDEEAASEYLESGEYYWNSGMFVFRASDYLAELESFAPEISAACRLASDGSVREGDTVKLAREPFLACPANSVDYAIMEKTARAAVVELDAPWSDVGSWASLYDVSEKDDNGNVIKGNAIQVDSSGNLLYAQEKVVAAIGIRNLVVIDTPEAILVIPRDRAQDVRQIVEKLKE